MPHSATTVVAVDPGSVKCGIAAVRRDAHGQTITLHRAVVPQATLETAVLDLCGRFAPATLLLGDATQSRAIGERLKTALAGRVPLETVDEAHSSEQARVRYLRENAPQGRDLWQRLLPLSLRTPPCPIDDYVAVLLAERWLEKML